MDGYFRRGSRFFWPLACLPFLATGLAVFILVAPMLVAFLALVALALGAIVFRSVGASWSDYRGFVLALPVFVPCYGGGLARGMFLATVKLLRNAKSV